MTRTPQSVPGLLRWGRADDAGVADGASVSSILDRVTGQPYTVFDPANAGPIYRASNSALNGLPALGFSGTRAQMLQDTMDLNIPSAFTVWAVIQRGGGSESGTNGANSVFVGADYANTASDRFFQLGVSSSPTNQFRIVAFPLDTAARVDPVPPVNGLTGWNMVTGCAGGDVSECFAGGSSNGGTTQATGTRSGTRKITIGNAVYQNGTAYNFVGRIAEWGFYDHFLNAAERSVLHSYIQDRTKLSAADYVAEASPWTRWNGTTETALTLEGVWDGTTVKPATVEKTT